MDELTITARPARRTYRFGPGSHESLTMTTWTTKHGIGRVRLRGTYSVFCGTGGEHSVRIDETATTVDLSDDAQAAAEELVELALDGWCDPCETGADR